LLPATISYNMDFKGDERGFKGNERGFKGDEWGFKGYTIKKF